MNHIYVRPLRMNDEADVAAFVAAVENCGLSFPSNVFSLPSTRVMVAERRQEHGMEIVGYQPHYIPLVLGSFIAISESDTELASAQHMLTAAAYTRAHQEGLAEILAPSNTEATQSYALRHGFTEAHKCLRMDVR